MTRIDLEKLHADPRNANVCSPEVMSKLQKNIERHGLCQHVLVRPHPQHLGHFIIIDGHHRKLVAETLGWQSIECDVKEMSEEEAGLLLLTLNRLRGTDVPRKRAELMQSLLVTLPVEDLSALLPESPAEIEGLLALLKADEAALEKAWKAQMAAEAKSLPVPFGFMIAADDVPIIHQALAVYQARTQADQGQALVAICRDVLTQQGKEEKPNET